MTSKNEITGDKLATKPANEAYRDNWDRIFGKKTTTEVSPETLEDAVVKILDREFNSARVSDAK